jgi:hypothetical protein
MAQSPGPLYKEGKLGLARGGAVHLDSQAARKQMGRNL